MNINWVFDNLPFCVIDNLLPKLLIIPSNQIIKISECIKNLRFPVLKNMFEPLWLRFFGKGNQGNSRCPLFQKNLKNRLSQFFPRNLSTRNYQIDKIKSSHPKSCKIIHVDLANNDHVSRLKHSYNQEFTSKSGKIIHPCWPSQFRWWNKHIIHNYFINIWSMSFILLFCADLNIGFRSLWGQRYLVFGTWVRV